MSASRYDHPMPRTAACRPARRVDAAPVPTVPRRRSHSWRTTIAVVMAAAIVCLAALLYATGGAPFGPTVSFDGLSSRYAMLIDADSGEVIESRDADARMYPASLTKVMTAVVVLALRRPVATCYRPSQRILEKHSCTRFLSSIIGSVTNRLRNGVNP